MDAVPDEPDALGAFACVTLHDEVEAQLGEEAARAVLLDLRPAFMKGPTESPTSGVRSRARHSLPAPRPDAPIVLVASPDARNIDALTPLLRNRVKLVAAYDVFSLLSAAQQYLTVPITLLLDDRMPSVKRSTLATLGRILPTGTRIITWGGGDRAVPWGEGPTATDWQHLGDVEPEAVAEACLGGLPAPPAAESAAEPLIVLVAHEDASWRHEVAARLERDGHRAISAPDGFMALERCIDESPHIVVAGMSMPTLDGLQLAELLESRFASAAPRILLIGPPVSAIHPRCVAGQLDDAADLHTIAEAVEALR